MNNFIRTLIAGYGAKKREVLSTILVFIVIYWALGTCNKSTNNAPVQRTHVEQVIPVSRT
ncbi:MAG: hypothetical protein WKF88_04590 [Ferruginibacter sp.]